MSGARGRAIWALGVLTLLGACAGGPADLDALAPPEPDAQRQRAQRRLQLATAYYVHQQDEVALQEARAALAIDPRYPEAYGLLALVHQRQGAPALAEQSYRQALALAQAGATPANERASIAHNYGWFLCQQGRLPEGQGQLQTALATPGYLTTDKTRQALQACQLSHNSSHHER